MHDRTLFPPFPPVQHSFLRQHGLLLTHMHHRGPTLAVAITLLMAVALLGDEPHWAYQPITRPSLPCDGTFESSTNPIDRLVSSKLNSSRIRTVDEADRVTLIRRVSLDLIGLPPTPEEVCAFVADAHPAAFERLVDRLLDSPHYGEHWARPWLDLCHYADTDGYLTDQARPVAWRYRAWLVDALNDGMPFRSVYDRAVGWRSVARRDDESKARHRFPPSNAEQS